MGRPQKEYALYKGDQFIMIGTAKEIAKERNVCEKSIQFYATPTYKSRYKNRKYEKTYFLVEVDNE
ncbi:MAG: hypothetical protein II006_03405 [Peptostreptococcaceae bacterium]|nr:hypothetical protein [Peptostreptococcaceae bacterium]